jgi:hypothetical protein
MIGTRSSTGFWLRLAVQLEMIRDPVTERAGCCDVHSLPADYFLLLLNCWFLAVVAEA